MPITVTSPSSRRRGRPPRGVQQPTTADNSLESTAQPSTELVGLRGFDPILKESEGGLPFMDAITMIRDNEWKDCRYRLYLYRVDPKVKNPTGSFKYIDWADHVITEESVANEHGGGTYQLYLRQEADRDKGIMPRSRDHVFTIDPVRWRTKLRHGQTMAEGDDGSGNPSGTLLPAPKEESENSTLARVLPELLDRVASKNNGQDIGVGKVMEVMTEANKVALSIVQQSQTTMTGTVSGDKALELLLEHVKNNGRQQHSATEQKLIDLSLERMANLQADGDPLGQLGKWKDLLGFDSITDLIAAGRGGAVDSWRSIIGEGVKTLVGNLPGILGAFNALQEASFRREMQLAAYRNQTHTPMAPVIAAGLEIPGSVATSPPASSVLSAAQPNAGPAGSPTSSVLEPPVDPGLMALDDIVLSYESGHSGDACAAFIKTKYSQLVPTLSAIMQNRQQVDLFCKNTPPLNRIASDEEFPEFLNSFIDELQLSDDATQAESLATSSPPTA